MRSTWETRVTFKRDVSSYFFPGARKTLRLTVSCSTGVFNGKGTVLVIDTHFYVKALKLHCKPQMWWVSGSIGKALPGSAVPLAR